MIRESNSYKSTVNNKTGRLNELYVRSERCDPNFRPDGYGAFSTLEDVRVIIYIFVLIINKHKNKNDN